MLYRSELHKEGVELYNCYRKPAYTSQHIVETMEKITELNSTVFDISNWMTIPAATIIGTLDLLWLFALYV